MENKKPRHSTEADPEAKRILARLKEVRNLRGWSPEQLSEKANVSVTTIQHAESNVGKNLRLNTLTKLMVALGISFDMTLFENIPEPEEEPPVFAEDDEYISKLARGLGYLIRSEREKRKITRASLCRKLGTSNQLLKRWERGDLTDIVLRFFKLLDLLGLEIYIEKRKDKNKDWMTDDE